MSPSFVPTGISVGIQHADGPDGKTGGSSAFAGSEASYIEIPQNYRLDTRYSITILAMVYPEGVDGPLVHFVPPSVIYGPHVWFVNNNLFTRIVGRGNFALAESIQSSSLMPRKWSYVGTSYDYSTGVVRNWINGEMISELSIGSMELATDQVIRMGAVPIDNRYFKGRISCVQIYKQALTKELIAAAKDACSDYKRSK